MLAESAVGDDVSVSVYRHGGWRADNSLTMSWRFLERAQRMACVGRRLHSTAKRVDAGSCAASTRIRAEGRRDALLAKNTALYRVRSDLSDNQLSSFSAHSFFFGKGKPL